nr:GNAT family N-acetyltransferase [Paraburkholderia oxyphila]
MPITYRHFTDNDVSSAQALTARHKWPLRAEDWRFMARAGTGFVALDGSAVIGAALCWTHGATFASLGMVTVSPAYRRRGLGRKLTKLALEALGSRVTFVHATDTGRSLHEKLGFRVAGKIDQHQGAAFQPPLIALPSGERLRPLCASDMTRLVELARRASGLDRSKILPDLVRNADGIALDRGGELIGFSLFRRFGSGRTIGPVIAPHIVNEALC